MTRVKRGLTAHKKHRELLNSTKGYRGTKRRLVRVAREAYLHAGQYAFHGRKRKKRDFRRLWITRISEAVKQEGISYSKFMDGLKQAHIQLDRKILSDLVLNHPKTFKGVVNKAKSAWQTPS